jgi:hypothetical protein
VSRRWKAVDCGVAARATSLEISSLDLPELSL